MEQAERVLTREGCAFYPFLKEKDDRKEKGKEKKEGTHTSRAFQHRLRQENLEGAKLIKLTKEGGRICTEDQHQL